MVSGFFQFSQVKNSNSNYDAQIGIGIAINQKPECMAKIGSFDPDSIKMRITEQGGRIKLESSAWLARAAWEPEISQLSAERLSHDAQVAQAF